MLCSSFNEPTCVTFCTEMRTFYGQIIIANNSMSLMDVLLIKEKPTAKHSDNKIAPILSKVSLKGLMGPCCRNGIYVFSIQLFFMFPKSKLPPDSFFSFTRWQLSLTVYEILLIAHYIFCSWKPLLKRRSRAVKQQDALLCIKWCKAFPGCSIVEVNFSTFYSSCSQLAQNKRFKQNKNSGKPWKTFCHRWTWIRIHNLLLIVLYFKYFCICCRCSLSAQWQKNYRIWREKLFSTASDKTVWSRKLFLSWMLNLCEIKILLKIGVIHVSLFAKPENLSLLWHKRTVGDGGKTSPSIFLSFDAALWKVFIARSVVSTSEHETVFPFLLFILQLEFF